MKILHKAYRLLAGIPGAVDLSVKLADLLGRPPRIDSSWRHLSGWLNSLDPSVSRPTPPDSRNSSPILFFSVYPHWIDYSLAIATLLVGRGAPVDFWWLDHMTPLAERPRPVREAYWKRQARRQEKEMSHSQLVLRNLSQIEPSEPTELMRKCAAQQAHIDVSYLLQKERIELESSERDRAVLAERFERNLEAIRRVAAAYQTRNYSHVLLGNGGILEFGAVYRYFQAMGARVTTFESVDIRNRIWVSHGASVVRADTSDLWNEDVPHILTQERRERVLGFMQERQKSDSGHLVIPYQKASPASARSIRKSLGLSEDRPIVLICPNVPFDAVFYSGGRQVFSEMSLWLVETCRYLTSRPHCQVVVRSHPAEPYYHTTETAAALLAEHIGPLPSHIKFVAPTDDISTYSIMEIADLGIVFASTTGLEMALRGIPVICGNPSQHYNRKGFTSDPETREDFFAAIDHVISDPQACRLTRRQMELAFCYADIYFHHWYRGFPYQAQTLWKDLQEWPVPRVLSEEGLGRFGAVLDELAGKSPVSISRDTP
jgi:hypothetical protein